MTTTTFAEDGGWDDERAGLAVPDEGMPAVTEPPLTEVYGAVETPDGTAPGAVDHVDEELRDLTAPTVDGDTVGDLGTEDTYAPVGDPDFAETHDVAKEEGTGDSSGGLVDKAKEKLGDLKENFSKDKGS